MKNTLYILTTLFFLASCTEEKNTFMHSLDSTNIVSGDIAYLENNEEILTASVSDSSFIIDRKEEVTVYDITLKQLSNTTVFKDIPAKYIHMDASVELNKKEFLDYFLDEWAPMKGVNFTSIRIVSNEDPEVFYIAVVHTGSDQQIAKHSEDF